MKDRHRSREFIEFLKLVDTAYPADTAIHLILDNHSAHISRETRAWLAEQPAGRFEFTFTPKHGSWLNLVEGFFSKLAPRRILSRSCPGIGAILMDRFATPSECWQQASLCRARADPAADERLWAVWMSMALIWTKLAAHKERLQRLNA